MKTYKIGSRRPEFTLAENPTVDDRQAEPDLRSGGSLKQEAETEKSQDFISFRVRFWKTKNMEVVQQTKLF